MKKLLSKLAVCLIATELVLSPLVGARQAKKADAATKRTAVVTSLLTNKGKINAADWTVVGDKNNIDVSNNGKVFKVTNATWPGYRIFPYATVPANTGYFVEMDVLKTNPATTKLNLSGYVTNFGNGAASNIYLSSIGIDVGAGTNYGSNGDGKAVWNAVNTTLEAGYRYRFWFRINPEDSSRGDLIIYKKSLADENADYAEGCVLYKLCTLTDEAHYAHVYFEGDIVIDNFAFRKEDGTAIFESDFSDANVFDSTGVPQDGKLYKNGGNIVNDSYLRLYTADKLVSALKVTAGEGLENVMDLETQIKVTSTAGKAGIVLGMKDENVSFGDESAATLAFENTANNDNSVTTKMSLISGGKTSESTDLGVMSDDMHSLKLIGKADGRLIVYKDGKEVATYSGVGFEGYAGIMTDGTAGAEISFSPEFTINAYKKEIGTGKDLENNFNTGYINPEYYENDTHNAVSLGNNAHGIVAKDGILKFDGTSDGTHFAINGVYADFILQFDWINYAWADRPTDGNGNVSFTAKPASGVGTELYSPLGVSFGKKEPTAGWNDTKLLRLFDTYNLIQFINSDETGLAHNETMGTGLAADQVTQIRDGKINFYEETVNIKIVANDGLLEVYGVVMKNGAPDGEQKLLASFEYENCTGYISLSTSEAGYFGIDNLRVTKTDGWTAEQYASYENFKTIADEKKPETLVAPVLSRSDKKVTWESVTGATGYIVTVNGVAGEKIEGTEYILSATEAGEYTITVKAVGDGKAYLDSEESAPVTIEIANKESVNKPESGSSGEESGKESGGCFGSFGAPGLLALVAFASGLIVTKKKAK